MTQASVILSNEHATVLDNLDSSWSAFSTSRVMTSSRSHNAPAARHRSHLPESQESRAGAVEAAEIMVRVTWNPIPRNLNPAHQHLISQESQDGARSKMYLLNHISRMFGASDYEHLFWPDLTPSAINTVLAALRDQGYKRSTRNAYLTALKSCAKEAWVLKQIDIDTYERIKNIKRVKVSQPPAGRAHDISILNGLLQYIENNTQKNTRHRDALILKLMIFTGMRRKEVTLLHYPRDFEFDTKEIKIQGKGGKIRVMMLPDLLWEKVIDYIVTERGKESGALFCPYWNKRYSPKVNDRGIDVSTINRIFESAVKGYVAFREEDHAGQLSITPHDIRRSYATLMYSNGLSIREIQILLDHASIETTETYVRDPTDSYSAKAASLGNSLLSE